MQGKLNQNGFFIYSACDSEYFEEFGRPFINSVLKNTTAGLHLHIFNPTSDQLEFCKKDLRISVSHEYIDINDLSKASLKWQSDSLSDLDAQRLTRILTAMSKSNDKSVLERVLKTYYACARFVRLKELTKPTDSFLALDIDAIVRSEIPTLSSIHDSYMFKITGRKARILAGGLYSVGTVNGHKFINEYAETLLDSITKDYIYWGIDQDVLDSIVPNYNVGDLPYTLIDWEMRSDSVVWTAKGKRKDLNIFRTEKEKYV